MRTPCEQDVCECRCACGCGARPGIDVRRNRPGRPRGVHAKYAANGHASPNAGRVFTPEWRANMSRTRKELGLAQGESNPRFNGYTSKLSTQIYNTDEYKAWRRAVFVRDGFACVLCGMPGPGLAADHIKALSKIKADYGISSVEGALACTELWDVDNGRTLCESCHRTTPNYGWRAYNALKGGGVSEDSLSVVS